MGHPKKGHSKPESEVDLVVTMQAQHKEKALERLRSLGFDVGQEMEEFSIAFGKAKEEKVEALRAVPGVIAVEYCGEKRSI